MRTRGVVVLVKDSGLVRHSGFLRNICDVHIVVVMYLEKLGLSLPYILPR